MTTRKQVVVVGAGIVGICCAAWLRQDGHDVVLVDAEAPGRSTSFGNAGAFAVSDIVPLSEPGVFRRIPGWMMDPLGPLALQWRYLPSLTPWLLRFVWAGRRSKMQSLTSAMAQLLNRVYADLEPLADWAGMNAIWRRHGSLTVYDGPGDLAKDAAKWQIKRDHGIRCDVVEGAQLKSLEPALDPRWQHAVHVPSWSHVDDPYVFTEGIARKAMAEGVTQVRQSVSAFLLEQGRVTGVKLAGGDTLKADHVVVAAGVWSGELAKQLGYKVPLESERGYHATLPNAGVALDKFILSASGGFVILPMAEGGIRVAGTVELASKDAPPNMRRAEVLIDKARQYLPQLNDAGASFWMGNRPALPDTVPVIGKAPRHDNVSFAFGHGHLGLTLGATTGRIIADLVAGRQAAYPQEACRIDRF